MAAEERKASQAHCFLSLGYGFRAQAQLSHWLWIGATALLMGEPVLLPQLAQPVPLPPTCWRAAEEAPSGSTPRHKGWVRHRRRGTHLHAPGGGGGTCQPARASPAAWGGTSLARAASEAQASEERTPPHLSHPLIWWLGDPHHHHHRCLPWS